jgi:hypothetical protein
MRYEEIMVNDKLVAQKCEFFVYLSEFPWQIELKERHETLG